MGLLTQPKPPSRARITVEDSPTERRPGVPLPAHSGAASLSLASRAALAGRPESLGPEALFHLQRLAGNAAVCRVVRSETVVQRKGDGDAATVEEEPEPEESGGERADLAALRENLGVTGQPALGLLPLLAQFRLPAMLKLHGHLGQTAPAVWRSRSQARALLKFTERLGGSDPAYAGASAAVGAARGDRFLLFRLLTLLERKWDQRGPLITVIGGLRTPAAQDAVVVLGRPETKPQVLATLACHPAQLDDVWRLVRAAGFDPNSFGPVVTLLADTGFPSAVVAFMEAHGGQAKELAGWVSTRGGNDATRLTRICQLLVAYPDHITEVRQVVDRAAGDPDLATPVLQLVDACAYHAEVLAFLVSLDAAISADTSRWVTTVAAGEQGRRNGAIGLLRAHPGHIDEVRRAVDLAGGDPDHATPVLQLVGVCAYRAEVLIFLVSHDAPTAASISQWVISVAGADRARADKVVDLLRAHPGHIGDVQDAVAGAAGDLDAAASYLTRLARFGYSAELMATATQLGAEHAEAHYAERMESLRKALPRPSGQKQKKRFDYIKKVELKKGKGASSANLDELLSTDPEFNRLDDPAQKAYVKGREEGTAAKPQVAAVFTSALEAIAAWATAKISPARLQKLFNDTKGDAVHSAAIARVMTLAGPDGDGLADALLGLPVPVAQACASLIAAGAPPKDVLPAAQMVTKHSDKEVSDWLHVAAKATLSEVVDFLNPFSSHIAVATILGQGLGTGSDAYDLCQTKTLKDAGKADATWLVTQRSDPDFASLCKLIHNREPVLKKLRELAVAASGRSMPLASLDSWFLPSISIDRMIKAIDETPPACTGCPTFVKLHLEVGVKPESVLLLSAAEAEARLHDKGEIAVVRWLQADVHYAGGTDPKFAKGRTGPRTGFLTAPGGYEIHTHWYTSEMKLTSMHVQNAAGTNGTELNKWKAIFPYVVNRAVTIHGLTGVAL